jgi:hypothetical protein
MSEESENAGNTGWFHCGKCGGLFAAELEDGAPASCPRCGEDPVPGYSELAFAQASGGGVLEEASRGPDEDSHRNSKRRTKEWKGGITHFVLIWAVVLVVLAVAVKFFRGADDKAVEPALNVGGQDDNLLAGNLRQLGGMVEEYLEEGVPEKRARFVLKPDETLRRMVGFEQGNQFVVSDDELEGVLSNVIDTPIGKGIETVWQMGPVRKVEAAFFEDEAEEWRLDWANMVRYSERNWPLFLAGEGANEAEFRLLARRRSQGGNEDGRISSVVLLGPRMDNPAEIGAASPEVLVDPDSRVGRILAAAFAMRDAGEGVYGSRAFELDPRGMIRVRVRLLREGESEKVFAIREVVACHWYDFDDLGLD